MSGYEQLLEWRYINYRTEDPTAEALGIPVATEPAGYPPLVAALREIIPADEPDPVKLWWEPDVVRWLYAGARMVLDTLPTSGGVVVLRESHEIEAWQYAVLNMRVVFAVAAGVWPIPAGTEQARHTMPKVDPTRHDHDRHLTEWLKTVVDTLTELTEPAATS